MTTTTTSRWLSISQAAAHLGVSRSRVYVFINERELPWHPVGGRRRIEMGELDAWVTGGPR